VITAKERARLKIFVARFQHESSVMTSREIYDWNSNQSSVEMRTPGG